MVAPRVTSGPSSPGNDPADFAPVNSVICCDDPLNLPCCVAPADFGNIRSSHSGVGVIFPVHSSNFNRQRISMLPGLSGKSAPHCSLSNAKLSCQRMLIFPGCGTYPALVDDGSCQLSHSMTLTVVHRPVTDLVVRILFWSPPAKICQARIASSGWTVPGLLTYRARTSERCQDEQVNTAYPRLPVPREVYDRIPVGIQTRRKRVTAPPAFACMPGKTLNPAQVANQVQILVPYDRQPVLRTIGEGKLSHNRTSLRSGPGSPACHRRPGLFLSPVVYARAG
jgi:hypothetical protein